MVDYSKEFTLSTAPQRSAEWYKERASKPSASMLAELFDLGVKSFDPELLTQYMNNNQGIAENEEVVIPDDIGF